MGYDLGFQHIGHFNPVNTYDYRDNNNRLLYSPYLALRYSALSLSSSISAFSRRFS